MPRNSDEALTRLHVHLFESDVKFIREHYSATIGQNNAIRAMVRSKIRELRAKKEARSRALTISEGDLT